MTDYADLKSAAAPEAMRAALAARADELVMAAHPHHPSAMADVREAEYRGHRIEVRTSYAITVDGRPFDIHIVVDNEGLAFLPRHAHARLHLGDRPGGESHRLVARRLPAGGGAGEPGWGP